MIRPFPEMGTGQLLALRGDEVGYYDADKLRGHNSILQWTYSSLPDPAAIMPKLLAS
jgi:hypothetical protein